MKPSEKKTNSHITKVIIIILDFNYINEPISRIGTPCTDIDNSLKITDIIPNPFNEKNISLNISCLQKHEKS